MSIKHHFVRLVEKITGRKCCRCIFNHGGQCNLNQAAFSECWQSITRPYFSRRNEAREPASAWAMDKSGLEPGDLTPEEKHQLGKIVEGLQEASATAKDAGLLGEDDQETETTRRMRAAKAAIWEDKTESGLFEED